MGKGAYYTGKLALFLLKTVLVLLFIGAVIYVAFHTAMNLGSVYVLSTEGMELRADVALGAESRSELVNYFTEDWLEQDGHRFFMLRSLIDWPHKTRIYPFAIALNEAGEELYRFEIGVGASSHFG